MGKGDKKTAKGKRWKGSYGNSRKRDTKKETDASATTAKATE